MNRRLFGALILALIPLVAMSQVEVSATFQFMADPSMSPKEAKEMAIERARIEAVAEKFGTLITQDVLSQMSDDNSYFMQLSTAELKGEWIRDLTPPVVKLVDTSSDNVFVYEAKVRGLARAVKNDAADFETCALRNGTDKRFASTDFKEGDQFYLYFKAPVDGYVAAFMIDEQQRVFCLLPYENSPEGQIKVEHDRNYTFFTKNDTGYEYDDGMIVTCDDEFLELNRIYVIFSPNPFVKPIVGNTVATAGNNNLVLPRQLNLKEFSKWMSKVYTRDKNMARKVLRIRIRK